VFKLKIRYSRLESNALKEADMAISTKYGKIDIPKIAADEPVFILRAQDLLAEPAIEMYRSLAASHDSAVVEKLHTAIEDFRAWGGSKKLPD
jgi:hypothetical protein